jgi:hypothetical protein
VGSAALIEPDAGAVPGRSEFGSSLSYAVKISKLLIATARY